MDFSLNRMPSTQKEIEWQWERVVKENIDFSEIRVNGASCDFEANLDYFNLTDTKADQISFIGRRYEFFEQAVGLRDFRLEIFGDIHQDNPPNNAYRCVLSSCAENSIYEVNEMLESCGYEPLGSSKMG